MFNLTLMYVMTACDKLSIYLNKNEKPNYLKLDYCYNYQKSYLIDIPPTKNKCAAFCYSKIKQGM